ncbi:hypothetical protein C8Q76DRAFT_23220 [Earliella scabrosa]|nr:hypothetical protein C8Q76DRAFT_23220 [Earliella scabrosa]
MGANSTRRQRLSSSHEPQVVDLTLDPSSADPSNTSQASIDPTCFDPGVRVSRLAFHGPHNCSTGPCFSSSSARIRAVFGHSHWQAQSKYAPHASLLMLEWHTCPGLLDDFRCRGALCRTKWHSRRVS